MSARGMMLQPGEPVPWFVAPSTSNPHFTFDTVAGRCVVLCFLGSAGDPYSRAVIDGFLAAREHFDDESACFFGVSTDPADQSASRLQQVLPGYRFFWDFQLGLSRLYKVHLEGESYRYSTFV